MELHMSAKLKHTFNGTTAYAGTALYFLAAEVSGEHNKRIMVHEPKKKKTKKTIPRGRQSNSATASHMVLAIVRPWLDAAQLRRANGM